MLASTAATKLSNFTCTTAKSTITRPVKQLVGFKRVSLQPGNSATIIFTVKMNQLGFYNREMQFVVEPGKMDVMIGSSSADIHLTGEFEIVGEVADVMGKRSYAAGVSVMQK